jgi:hypothetical protein
MKNSNDTIGNGTRDLPTCSAVPQPTAPPAACPLPQKYYVQFCIYHTMSIFRQFCYMRERNPVKRLFRTIIVPLMMGQLGPRLVGICGFYNVIVTVPNIACICWFE